MSFLSWLDYSESERRKMLDVISLFQQKETRDELGLGTVRDAFADIFFPGTSTIQTRARYFLFVPWTYLQIERRNRSSNTVSGYARKAECNLIETLLASGEEDGVIGKVARRNLQRLPSNIYWSGMQKWRVLLFGGSHSRFHKWVENRDRQTAMIQELIDDEESDVAGQSRRAWNPAIPKAPAGFPKEANFRLLKNEAEFLKDQILQHCRHSLLAFLVLKGEFCSNDIVFAWMHPQYSDFPSPVREKLEHARNFSEIMHGAAWLYNLMLAEQAHERFSSNDVSGYEELVRQYGESLSKWGADISSDIARFKTWNRTRFWEIVGEQNPRIPQETKLFVMEWIENTFSHADSMKKLVSDRPLRSLILGRERFLKREKARLSNEKALELWKGDSGIGQLDFRWRIARVILNDILTGLGKD